VYRGAVMAERVTLTAWRDSTKRTRTVALADADVEADRLRGEGWTVTIGPPRADRETARAQKQRAAVIAAHRSARRARQGADDAARDNGADPG
jgi:hypothetical protein